MKRACILAFLALLAAAPFAAANPSATVMGYLVGWPACGPLEICTDPVVEAWAEEARVAQAFVEHTRGGIVYRVALPVGVQGLVTFAVDGAPAREYFAVVPGGTYAANLTPRAADAPAPQAVDVVTRLPNATPNEVVRVETLAGEVVAAGQADAGGEVRVAVPAWPESVRLVRGNLEAVNVTLAEPEAWVVWPAPANAPAATPTPTTQGEQVLDPGPREEIPFLPWSTLAAGVGAALLVWRSRA